MRLIFSTIFCYLALSLPGQSSYEPTSTDPMLEPWRYAFFPELDGMGIKDMDSEKDGSRFWFALDSGVMSYDGYNWKMYNQHDGITGPIQKVHCGTKNTYVANDDGLFLFKDNRWVPEVLFPENTSWTINSLKETLPGLLMAATNQGLIIISGDHKILLSNETRIENFQGITDLKLVKIPNELLAEGEFDSFSDVLAMNDDRLWIGITYNEDENGEVLEMYINEILVNKITRSTKIGAKNNIDLGSEHSFLKSSHGSIWVVNKMNKVPPMVYDKGKWEKESCGALFGDDEYAEDILETEDGSIWVSSIGKLYRKSPDGKWSKYSHLNSQIPQAHVKLHFAGNDLWIYGYQSTVFKVDLSHDRWLSYQHLNYMGESPTGVRWFLDVDGNAVSESDDTWLKTGNAQGMIDAPVRLFLDGEIVWAIGSHQGTAAAGFYKDGRWKNFQFASLSWSLDYRDILKTQNGDIWLGACTDVFFEKGQTGGMAQIQDPYSDRPHIILHPARTNGFDQLNVYGMVQTQDGQIWAGGTQLYYFDGLRWFRHPNQNFQDFVNILYTDSSGRFFVGSRQHGLYIQEGDEWINHNLQNNLISNNIISITASSENEEIWIATDRDISFFNGQTWINEVFPDELKLTQEGGNINEGENNELWINHSPREWKRRVFNERIPSEEISSRFRTIRLSRDVHYPETELFLQSLEVGSEGNTHITWSGKHYFNKIPQSELKYSYCLNDEEWSRFSNQSSHTFTGLSSGDYVIQVRAMDRVGNIDPTPAEARFYVNPPVWREPWFIILVTVFLVIIIFYQWQLIRKRQTLQALNVSLQNANEDLETKNNSLTEAYEKIEELSNAKVKFFTNITHELKTPLSLIIGPMEKLMQDSTRRQNNFYHIIRRNALRLQKLINQLLEIRRIESGYLELKLNKADIVDFVRQTLDFFKEQALKKGIKLEFKSSEKSLMVSFDADKVEKILFNLISNAIKYSYPKGMVSINLDLVPKVDGVAHSSSDFYRLTIEDHGKGMDEETVKKLFERFARGEEDHGTIMEGSGIGMSYIKDLIEVHGGSIEVNSRPGVGTKAEVFLPCHLITGDPDFTKSTLPEDVLLPDVNLAIPDVNDKANGGTILVVEDNEDMNYFICEVLKEDFRVLSANDGSEGLLKLEEEEVDLIISDIMMPQLDGISFCKKVKQNPAISHTPVILLTALGADDKVVKGYESGADSYIVKPFNPDVLITRVENLLAGREQLRKSFQRDFRFEPKEIEVGSYDEEFLNKLSELIESNVSNSAFDLSKLAEETNLSYSQFSRKVKQLTGKKPKELLRTFRLTRAKQLLVQQKIPVSEVGYMVGYDVPNSFTRAFKAEYGVSPTEFCEQEV